MTSWDRISFYGVQADSSGGAANRTATVQTASSNAGANAEAIAFKSRRQRLTGTVESLTDTTSSSRALTAGDAEALIAEVLGWLRPARPLP